MSPYNLNYCLFLFSYGINDFCTEMLLVFFNESQSCLTKEINVPAGDTEPVFNNYTYIFLCQICSGSWDNQYLFYKEVLTISLFAVILTIKDVFMHF